ncbi:gluconokinase [Pelagerythrobacter rhizovicinus]|nr:gluconokinase, GntK/IdnK-type [Pelagerythrobacter rhizovicinus]
MADRPQANRRTCGASFQRRLLKIALTGAAVAVVAVVLTSTRRHRARRNCPEAVVVMGPSGCGKSTLARALAAYGGWPMLEGDDHHPPRNKAKLARGVPLTEQDRVPFLDSIGRSIRASARPVVVSCSALRRAHREQLRRYARDILFAWVDVPADELDRRIRRRSDHFMPPSLLGDQLETLEPPARPERFVRIDGRLSTADQLRVVLSHLESCPRRRGRAAGRSVSWNCRQQPVIR